MNYYKKKDEKNLELTSFSFNSYQLDEVIEKGFALNQIQKNNFQLPCDFQGVRTFKLSLCSVYEVGACLTKKESLYRFLTFKNALTFKLVLDSRFEKHCVSRQITTKRKSRVNTTEGPKAKIPRLNKSHKPHDTPHSHLDSCDFLYDKKLVSFTTEYEFCDCGDEEVDDYLKSSKLALCAVYDKEAQQSFCFTQKGLNLLKRAKRLTQEEVDFLRGINPLEKNSSFNFTKPLLKQNYEDDLLFVNSSELRLQIQLIKYSLSVFLNQEVVLSPFFVSHEGLMIKVQPFSCILGAFHYKKDEVILENKITQVTSMLTQVIYSNREQIVELMEQCALYSKNHKSSFFIAVQLYAFNKRKKDKNLHDTRIGTVSLDVRFSWPIFISTDQLMVKVDLESFGCNSEEKLNIDAESFNFVTTYRKTNKVNKEFLYVFKLFVFDSFKEIEDIISQNGFKCFDKRIALQKPCKTASKRKTASKQIEDSSKQDTSKQDDCKYDDFKYAIPFVAQGKYSDIIAKFCGSCGLNVYEGKGITVQVVLDSVSLPLLGQAFSLKALREKYHVKKGKKPIQGVQEIILMQNSIPQEKVTVSYLIKNVLFVQQTGFVGSTQECWQYQLEKLNKNLDDFQKRDRNVKTQFLLFNGATFHLEIFDFIVGVVFNNPPMRDHEKISNNLIVLIRQATKFFKEKGFLARLSKTIGKKLQISVVITKTQSSYLKKSDTPGEIVPMPFFKAKKSVDHMCKIGEVDKDFILDSINKSTSGNNISVFIVSLCDLKEIGEYLAAQGRTYISKMLCFEFISKRKGEERVQALKRKPRFKNFFEFEAKTKEKKEEKKGNTN